MLLLETERYILESTLLLKPYPEDAPIMSLKECLPYFTKMIDNGEAVYFMRNNRIQIRIKSYSRCKTKGKKSITFLIQYTDADASDPAFGHMETGETRLVEKQEKEGLTVTAHLVIGLKPINDAMPNVHYAVLENVNGITKTNINSAFTSMLHSCTNFEFNDDGSNKKCRPMFELNMNASKTLEDLLSRGFVSGFKAIKYRKKSILDEEGDLEVQEECLEIRAKRKKGQAAVDLIKRAAKIVNKQDYSRLMIKYQDENNRQKTLDMSTDENNWADTMFGKSEKVYLGDVIQQCEKTIHEELNKKMQNYLFTMYT